MNQSKLTKLVTANKAKAGKNRACQGLKEIDIYGEPVILHYKGKATFNTKVGAILTIVTYVWLSFVAGIGFVRVYEDWNPVLSEYKKPTNMTGTVLNPFEKGREFDISFGIPHEDMTHDLSYYGHFDVQYVIQEKDKNGRAKEKIKHKIEFQQCDRSVDYSSAHDHEAMKEALLGPSRRMNCIQNKTNIELRGDYEQSNFTYLKISFERCDATLVPKCASTRELDQFFSKNPLEIYYLEANINLDDFSKSPVQYRINSEFFMYLSRKTSKIMDMFISPLTFEREEDFIQFGQENTDTNIYRMGRVREYDQPALEKKESYSSVYLRLSKDTVTVERQTVGLLAVAGLIGGWFQIVLMSGTQLVSLFSSKMYLASVIRKLYHIRNLPDVNSIQKCKDGHHHYKWYNPFNACDKHAKKHDFENKIMSYNLWRYIEQKRYQFIQNNIESKEKITKQTRAHLVNSVVNRKEFKYTRADLIQYFTRCICLKSTRALHKSYVMRRNLKLRQGTQKYIRELDVVKVVKTIRNQRVMKNIQFTQLQRILLQFQYQRFIISDDSESADEKHNSIKLLRSKNFGISLLAMTKLRNAFKGEEDFDEHTKELINGVYHLQAFHQSADHTKGVEKQSMQDKLKAVFKPYVVLDQEQEKEEEGHLVSKKFRNEMKKFFSEAQQRRLLNMMNSQRSLDNELYYTESVERETLNVTLQPLDDDSPSRKNTTDRKLFNMNNAVTPESPTSEKHEIPVANTPKPE